MDRKILKTLNRLCSETELLQHRVDQGQDREVYESIAKAKDNLLEAIRRAEATQ